MNCKRAKELFPDCLAGGLDVGDRAELDRHLEACGACREEQQSLFEVWTKLSLLPQAEPGPALDERFQTMLEGYRAGLEPPEKAKPPRFSVANWLTQWWPRQPAWQFAMALLIFCGGLLAGWGSRQGPNGVKSVDSASLAEMRHEIAGLKEQVMLALLQQRSASERLRGVEWTTRIGQPDERVMAALLRALDSDPNVNVRLAVVDALQPFAREDVVRKALLDSLPRQHSPLVQVELIQLMVEMEDKASVPVLQSLLDKPDTDEFVRERAKWGLAQLG